ncbi:hypothetical protein LZC95_07805 [Pendulispora brunnea]|uniref:Uncharacterized protein n=1 Tax=Pendulispora brunnea TaxID=2905690 RepID=A0ABZ2KFA5_9BACT
MFSSELQTNRACRALLALMRLEHMWTPKGPTIDAIDIYQRNGAGLSTSERAVFLAAWAFYDRPSPLLFSELFLLGTGATEAICSLLVALARGPREIDKWLGTYERA